MHKLIPAAAAALALAAPALAHHSFSMFDRTRQVMIEGTVAEWHFNSPHTWLYVEAPDQSGALVRWGFEGGAPVHAVRQGVNGQTFSYGETVRVVMSPLKDGRPAGGVCFVVKADGAIAQHNDGACPADQVLERWRANGWLESAGHLESHPIED
jgi:hypothetical protein